MILYTNKITFCVISLLVINSSLAMENEKIIIPESFSSSGSQSNSFSESLMYYAPTKEGLWNACGAVVTSVGSIYENAVVPTATSLYTTVTIKGSDDSAFIKLGYPITDQQAQIELRKSLENYIHYSKLKQQLSGVKTDYKNGMVRQQYDLLHNFIQRRKDFVDRAANSLPTRLDGVSLARHCLKYHDYEPVMTAPIKNIIFLFIASKTKAYKEATLSFSEQLTQLTELNKSQKIDKADDGKKEVEKKTDSKK